MPTPNGIITTPAPTPSPKPSTASKSLLKAKNVTVFARVDHSGEAAKAGLEMPPTQLLIFGSPKGWHARHARRSHLSHRSPAQSSRLAGRRRKSLAQLQRPEYLKTRFSVPDELLAPISGLSALMEQALT